MHNGRDREEAWEGGAEYPEAFVARAREQLGPEAEAFLAALSEPPLGLRVNTLRLAPGELRARVPFALEPLAYPTDGFLVADPGARAGKHPYHAAGLYYLQDPAAMAVAALLDPRPGERVLDLAAAPGGKSTHLASLLEDRGLLVANDVHPGRARELAGNLERWGVRNALVTSETAERLAGHFGAFFDRVLLDAPCSGEAMFWKSAAARREWSPAAVEGCARRQADLLGSAARLVRPGGRLLYSTCTFAPEENEGVIAGFLAAHPDFELVELERVPGALGGRPEWAPEAVRRPELVRTLRLWPHRVRGAGHFIAGLRRREGEESHPGEHQPRPVPRAVRELLAELEREQLRGVRLGEGALELRGEELFEVPVGTPDLARLRVVRPGLWLASVHRDRLTPAHALAMTLAPDRVRDALVLGADDPETAAFLRGESVSRAGEKGWVLVTVDGFPLGWGKRVGAMVKNHYPKGLRWLS